MQGRADATSDAPGGLNASMSFEEWYGVANFLHFEAELLDLRQYREWLKLLCDDFVVWAPLARNVHSSNTDDEHRRGPTEVAWIDEGVETLTKRAVQLETGEHWAEEPVSRVSRMVTNIMAERSEHDDSQIRVTSRVLIYRNRGDVATDVLTARRVDLINVGVEGYRFAERHVFLNQNVLTAGTLPPFL